MAALRLALVLVVGRVSGQPTAAFKDIDASGAYTIAIGAETFLESGSLRIRRDGKDACTGAADGCARIAVTATTVVAGTDTWGAFNETTVAYGDALTLGLRTYSPTSAAAGALLINVTLPSGLTGAAATVLPPYAAPPANVLWSFATKPTKPLRFLTWNSQDEFSYQTGSGGLAGACALKQCDEYAGLPIVLHTTNASVVLAPVDRFKDLEVGERGGEWGVGLRRPIKGVEPGYSAAFAVVTGASPRRALARWGTLMRKRYDRKLHDPSLSPDTKSLGYWTDNGAAYYHHTYMGATYAQTFAALDAARAEDRLPFASYQLDSWFYPKDEQGGLLEWAANATVLPAGLPALVGSLGGPPVVAHGRWVSPNATYAADERYDFFADHKTNRSGEVSAVPRKTRRFYADLVGNASRAWGVSTYEQDWLDAIFTKSSYLTETAGAIAAYMGAMGRGCADAGATIGYGSANPFHVLGLLEVHNAAWVFASNNPTDGPSVDQNFRISRSALLTYEVGVASMKDTFRSSGRRDRNGANPRYDFPHGWPSPGMHGAVALLSNGPVGAGDGVGASDRDALLRLCDANGELLRPTRPCLASDASLAPGFVGELCDAYADVGGGRYHYVLGAALGADARVTIADLPDATAVDFYATSVNGAGGGPLGARGSLLLARDANATSVGADHAWDVLRLSPALAVGDRTFFLLGELAKYVSVSPSRFPAVATDGGTLTVDVRGAANETVDVAVAGRAHMETTTATATCAFGEAAVMRVSCAYAMPTAFACACAARE